jgi:tetratricopeptide (TPR) repeat protein
MTRRLAPLLVLPLVFAASAAAPPEVDDLLRGGNAAFARGDYARAVALYEKAEVRATDPGLVLFNLAAAQYQLARQGDAKALAAAESAYRVCAARKGPRRAEALYGLANCLLMRGSQGQPDGLVLRGAIDVYTRCLRDPACGDTLAADARYNQGRARLLLLQVPPREGAADDGGGNEDGPEEERNRDKKGPDKNGDRPDGTGDKRPVTGTGAGTGAEPGEKKEGGEGGALPAAIVPDRADAQNLPEPEAAALLRQASRRIVEDLQRHRRERKRPSAPGARDW